MQLLPYKSRRGKGLRGLGLTTADQASAFQTGIAPSGYVWDTGATALPAFTDPYKHSLQPAPGGGGTPANIVTTVSPVIQTQASPQISPVFQQSYMPSGSPMTAGTTQLQPTTQTGTYQPTPQPIIVQAPQQPAQPGQLTLTTTDSGGGPLPAQTPSTLPPVDGSGSQLPTPQPAQPSGFFQSPNAMPIMIAGGVALIVLALVATRKR